MNSPFWRGFELGTYQAHALASVPIFIVSWLGGWTIGMGYALVIGLIGTYAWREVYGFAWRPPTDRGRTNRDGED